MRSRTEGMWWGTAIETPDPAALARFYSALLGWPIRHEEPGTTILAAPEGSIYVVFQQATVVEGSPPLVHDRHSVTVLWADATGGTRG